MNIPKKGPFNFSLCFCECIKSESDVRLWWSAPENPDNQEKLFWIV